MSLATLTNVVCRFGTNEVLSGVTMAIERSQRIGLVGRNGTGKSTLLNILSGQVPCDSGSVEVQRGLTIGALAQERFFDPSDTVLSAAGRAFARTSELKDQLAALFEEMAHAEGAKLDALMRQQVTLEEQLEVAGGYVTEHRVEAMLHGLGFATNQFDQKVTVLSGGQLARLALAQLLLESPDILVLDEPTNHLDIEARKWLEDFLIDSQFAAIVLVTHDRWLLDRVVDKIIEVDNGRLFEYPGHFSNYLEQRSLQRTTLSRQYTKQMTRVRQEEGYIRRYKAGQRSKQAKGRESRLDRFRKEEMIDRPRELDVIKLKIPEAPRSGDQVVVAQEISKSFGDLKLFQDLSLTITRGDRVGIIGPNGVGKTTLIRCLLGQEQVTQGEVRPGSRLSTGYFKQVHDGLDLSLSIWQAIQITVEHESNGRDVTEQQARDLAGGFLFSGEEQDQPLHLLSGGERARVRLAGLLGSPHNLLVMDEPSNHLDIPAAARLEEALAIESGFSGTLLLITHDRALLQATCTRLIIFDINGEVTLFTGTYEQWLSQTEKVVDKEKGSPSPGKRDRKKSSVQNAGRQASEKASTSGQSNLSHLSLKKLEDRIETFESDIKKIDQELSQPDIYTNPERCRDLTAMRERLVVKLLPYEAEWSERGGAA